MNEKIEYTTNQIRECEMYIERISSYINESGIKTEKNKKIIIIFVKFLQNILAVWKICCIFVVQK